MLPRSPEGSRLSARFVWLSRELHRNTQRALRQRTSVAHSWRLSNCGDSCSRSTLLSTFLAVVSQHAFRACSIAANRPLPLCNLYLLSTQQVLVRNGRLRRRLAISGECQAAIRDAHFRLRFDARTYPLARQRTETRHAGSRTAVAQVGLRTSGA